MVKPDDPCLSILILTEDSAKDSTDTVAALAKKMLLLADPSTRTHRIEMEPQGEEARRAMRGNLWKSSSRFDRAKIVDLGRIIAAKLLAKRIPGFVLFHFDGDCIWAERATGENVVKFDDFVQRFVVPSIDHALRQQLKKRPASVDVERDKAAAMKHLLPLTPHYSIEAWVYQNTTEALRICTGRCGLHLKTIKQWQADRDSLDEVYKPKEAICLHAKHNHTLAGTGFPSEAAFGAGKSYAAAVRAFIDCANLLAALARTHT